MPGPYYQDYNEHSALLFTSMTRADTIIIHQKYDRILDITGQS